MGFDHFEHALETIGIASGAEFEKGALHGRYQNTCLSHAMQGLFVIHPTARTYRIGAHEYVVIHSAKIERCLLNANVRFDTGHDDLRSVDTTKRLADCWIAARAKGILLQDLPVQCFQSSADFRHRVSDAFRVLFRSQHGQTEDARAFEQLAGGCDNRRVPPDGGQQLCLQVDDQHESVIDVELIWSDHIEFVRNTRESTNTPSDGQL